MAKKKKVVEPMVNELAFQPEDLNQDGIVTAEEAEAYRKHIVRYFDTQLGSDIVNLKQSDKFRFFQLLTDYADILEKIFHPGIDIIEHVLNKRWDAANRTGCASANREHDCQIIREYDDWKLNVSSAETQV